MDHQKDKFSGDKPRLPKASGQGRLKTALPRRNSASMKALMIAVLLILLTVSVVPLAHAGVFNLTRKHIVDPGGSGYTFIKVCIDPDSDILDEDKDSAGYPTGLDTVVGKVRNAARRHWEANSGVRFVGWDWCPDNIPQDVVPIYIHANADNNSWLGTHALGPKPSKNDQTSFKTWGNSDKCLDDFSLYDCAEQYGLHELGHVLGFGHEWWHPNTPEEDDDVFSPDKCKESIPNWGENDNWIYSPDYDPNSLMDYSECADVDGVRFGSEQPTGWDIELLQQAYGMPIPNGDVDVGVIPDKGVKCPMGTEVIFFMDNEDDNDNDRDGWIGDIDSYFNTKLKFCRVNGAMLDRFLGTGFGDTENAYAVLRLGDQCPVGSKLFEVNHDNENSKNLGEYGNSFHNNWTAGQDGENYLDHNAQLDFCVFPPAEEEFINGRPVMRVFPDFGFDYGVIAGPAFLGAEETGFVLMDEEDYSWFDGAEEGKLLVDVNEFHVKYYLAKVITDWPPTINSVSNDGPINEGGNATISVAASDPAGAADPLRYEFDCDNDGSYEVGPQAGSSISCSYGDDGGYQVNVLVSDGDGGTAAGSTTVTVNNVDPTINSVTHDGPINEGGSATISVAASDPAGAADPLSYEFDCDNDGSYEVGPQAGSSISCSYGDDGGNQVNVLVSDGDGGTAAGSTTVTVNNVAPTVTIDSLNGGLEGVALIGVPISLAGSFSDMPADTHTATVDWGDGTIGSAVVDQTADLATADHIFATAGSMNVVLTVTDDDGGVGPAEASITVFDASGATADMIGQLEALAAVPSLDPAAVDAINDAIAQLEGQNSGRAAADAIIEPLAQPQGRNGGRGKPVKGNPGDASGGALDILAKGNLNAALVKMGQAMQSLETAETADASLDLTSIKSLLSLAAKSAAMEAIVKADAAATKRNEMRKVEDAYELIDDADDLLAARSYVAAVDKYREAAQEVQGIK